MSDFWLTESSEALTARLAYAVGDEATQVWCGRAREALGALLKVLVHLRDAKGQPITLSRVRENFQLDNLVTLARRSDVPVEVVEPLRDYVRSLPGFATAAAKGEPLGAVAHEQHGYLQRQFARVWAA